MFFRTVSAPKDEPAGPRQGLAAASHAGSLRAAAGGAAPAPRGGDLRERGRYSYYCYYHDYYCYYYYYCAAYDLRNQLFYAIWMRSSAFPVLPLLDREYSQQGVRILLCDLTIFHYTHVLC